MTRHRLPGVLAVACLSLAGVALAACGGPAAPAGRLAVVAGEDTWGDVAAQLGGTHVEVTSLITNPNADPHEYTADVADAAAIHAARLVIVNGAGYDQFMGQLLSASGTSPRLLTVAVLAHATGASPNPHFWYDLSVVRAVATAITADYVRLDPTHAGYFQARLVAFDRSLDPIAAVVAELRRDDTGAPVAYTERVPGYLLEAAGLDVRTPTGFARSIEDGQEPGLADTLAMERLVTRHEIRVLLYNIQTITPVTAQVRALAVANGVPVVGVSETLPAQLTFQQWQLAQDRALLGALSR